MNRSREWWRGQIAIVAVGMLVGCKMDDTPGYWPGPDASSSQQETSELPGLDDTGASDEMQASEPGQSVAAGALTVVPSYVDLGAVTQGFAARARLRVSNTGDTPLAAPQVAWSADSDADLTLIQNQCAAELLPGEQCDLRVQVVPSSLGSLQGTLEVATAGVDTGTVTVTASGLEPGPLVMAPAAGSFQDFGGVRVGGQAEGTFTVTNPSDAASGILSFSFNRPEFELLPAATGGCEPGITELGSGESCELRVVFSPAERGGLETTLSVTSTEAGSRSLTLRGRGLLPGRLGVSAPLLSFGGVVPGDTASLQLAVENDGDEAVTLARPELTPAEGGAFRIADSNCGEGVVLEGKQRCRIVVDYRPTEAGRPSAGELVVASQGGELSESIELQGTALTRGNLVVEALTAGDENFGEVLLGQRVSRVFRVSNPTQQPSGALHLAARNGFEIEPYGEAGACEPDVTELGNAESCTTRVSFVPSSRGARVGALTVDSSLAGAKSLELYGRGILPGTLEADTATGEAVVDFGRVTTGSNASRTITLRNTGDEPLSPPQLQVTSRSPNQAAAFVYESGCTEPLAADAECEVTVEFAPETVAPYAASLELSGAGRSRSVLLLGEALNPGRLELSAADGASANFGDVPVGTTTTQAFTVTNPGGGSSGALGIRTDDSQFVVPAGACSQAGADGLSDGESCTFEVSFTPTTNVATEARLSVQSANSGETGVALRGRGRRPAALAATTSERDLGRANIGQPSSPANEFTWTVNNGGDLPSGSLSISNDNPDDFDITADTCSGQAVAGGGSWALTIVVAPDTAGNRSARIGVTGPGGGLVPLQVTGFGVQLAGPGERCVASSDCREGVCSAGVCCNQECGRTCESCATGQCVPQNGQERCGNGGGVCFGVEQCALPAGGGCTSDNDCGGNLVCKECQGGGRQCRAPDDCCGCEAPYTCVDGECGCPLQSNGLQRIDCGDGLCALNREGACCPGFAPNGCNCDSSDNLCKECLDNSHCTNGPANSAGQCNTNGTCSYSCASGFKNCNGQCIRNDQCCNCGAGQQCVNGQCLFGNVGLGQACNVQANNCSVGTCVQGVCACSGSTPNACGGRCVNLQTDPGNCGQCGISCGALGCNGQGRCNCPEGQTFVPGVGCRLRDGEPCTLGQGVACETTCTQWFADCDGDNFPASNTPLISRCGAARPSGIPQGCSNPAAQFVSDRQGRIDCCDLNAGMHPDQDEAFRVNDLTPQTTCGDWKRGDFNCDGRIRYLENLQEGPPGADCFQPADLNPPCDQRSGIYVPDVFRDTIGEVFAPNGDAALCGNSSVSFVICRAGAGNACERVRNDLAPPCN